MKASRIILLSAITALAACRIEVESPVEGSVTTQSGAIDCPSGQSCTVEVDDTFFDETFVQGRRRGDQLKR